MIPSITEPFGLVVLEALASGARVLGSDVGGIGDMLAGGTGRLVPPGDDKVLAQAIFEEYECKRTGTFLCASREVLTPYDWSVVGDTHAQLMASLVLETPA